MKQIFFEKSKGEYSQTDVVPEGVRCSLYRATHDFGMTITSEKVFDAETTLISVNQVWLDPDDFTGVGFSRDDSGNTNVGYVLTDVFFRSDVSPKLPDGLLLFNTPR